MFNLLVTSNNEAWDGPHYTYDRGRAFEHTAPALEDALSPFKGPNAQAQLKSIPTLFAYEDENFAPPARLGKITEILTKGNEVRVRFRFVPGVEVPNEWLHDLSWELDLANWEMSRTHWALKDVDLLAVLEEGGYVNASQVRAQLELVAPERVMAAPVPIAPTVFRVPQASQSRDLVAVMMPFAQEFLPVFEAISGACSDVGLRCQRADSIWRDSVVIQDVFELMYCSRVVVVDFSTKNPNVMYETGIAHTLGRVVVPLSQSPDDVPFDLRHHRYLKYLANDQGLAMLRSDLTKRLRTLTT